MSVFTDEQLEYFAKDNVHTPLVYYDDWKRPVAILILTSVRIQRTRTQKDETKKSHYLIELPTELHFRMEFADGTSARLIYTLEQWSAIKKANGTNTPK